MVARRSDRRPRLIGPDLMRLLQHIASMLLLTGLWCHAAQAAGEPDPLAEKSHAGPPQNGGMCWPALTRSRRRSRPVVQAGCSSSLSLVADARAAPDWERSIVR